ncbi:MAG: hypothetical protein IJI37_05630 [Opitutales bacterium]|nr:hypothetical protein [Opitutales bacterium]
MAKTSPKLTRCKIRLGKDLNWWVVETNDKINWDIDGLSVIDPRQASHLLDTLDGLREYGFDESILEKAFIPFSIDSKDSKNDVKIVRTDDSVFDADDQQLFLLPDLLDDERSGYAEFLDHITKLQVKMLNDTFQFEKDVAIEDLEEEIRDNYSNDYMEGRAIHVFREVMDILEYVPAGYSLDDEDDESSRAGDSEENYDIDDLPEEEENIEEDDTMHWDEEESEDEYEDTPYEDNIDFDEE